MRRIRLLALAMIMLLSVPGVLQAADKAQEAKEKSSRQYMQYGLVLADEGREQAAVKAFQESIKMDPNNAEAYSLMGTVLARMGKGREAEEALRKSVNLKPGYKEGWYYLGLFLKSQGKDAEAQQALQKAK